MTSRTNQDLTEKWKTGNNENRLVMESITHGYIYIDNDNISNNNNNNCNNFKLRDGLW